MNIFHPVDCEIPKFEFTHKSVSPTPLTELTEWVSFGAILRECISQPIEELYESTAKHLLQLFK